MTTDNMKKISNTDASREKLCNEIEYMAGYTIYVALTPILSAENPAENPVIYRTNKICQYILGKPIDNVAQVDDHTFDTFVANTELIFSSDDEIKHGTMIIDGQKKNVVIKYSKYDYERFSEEVILHNHMAMNVGIAPRVIGYRTCVGPEYFRDNQILVIDDISNELNKSLSDDISNTYFKIIQFIITERYIDNVVFYNMSLNNIILHNDKFYVPNLSKAVVYTDEINNAIDNASLGNSFGIELDMLGMDLARITKDIIDSIRDSKNEKYVAFRKLILKQSLEMPSGWVHIYSSYYRKSNKVMDYDTLINYLGYILFRKPEIEGALFGLLSCPYGDYKIECAEKKLEREDVANIVIDSDISFPQNLLWASGTTKDGHRVTIRKLDTDNIEPMVCFQSEAYKAGLSTEILSYWRCSPSAVIIMNVPRGIHYLDLARDNEDNILEIYLDTISHVHRLNWTHGILVGNDVQVFLDRDGISNILGFSEKTRRNSLDIRNDSFMDIDIITDRFLSLNLHSEKYKTFIKYINMYVYARVLDIHRDLYNKDKKIPSTKEFVTLLRNKLTPNVNLLNILLPFNLYDIKDPLKLDEFIGEQCLKDSQFIDKCPEELIALTSEELNLIDVEREHIAVGANGKVFRGKYNNDTIIIKHTKFFDNQPDRFRDEVCNQNLAAKYGVSPDVLAYWKCQDKVEGIVIMNYIHGKTFFQCMLSEEKIVEIYLTVMSTVMYLNLEVGIIHADLHSENALVTKEDVFLIDYGWSYRTKANFEDELSELSKVELAADDNVIKRLTDCREFNDSVIRRLNYILHKAYGLYTTIVFNKLHRSDTWLDLHLTLYKRLNRKPRWNELYELIYAYFRHLLFIKERTSFYCYEKNIPIIPIPLNGVVYSGVDVDSFKSIKYDNVMKSIRCDYYYGTLDGAKVTVAVHTDIDQFLIHQKAAESGIAPDILGFYICGRHYILLYRRNGQSVDNMNMGSIPKRIYYRNYLGVLKAFLILNLQLAITHNSAMAYCVEFLEDRVLINKFSTAKQYKIENYLYDVENFKRKPQVFVDPLSLVDDFCKLAVVFKRGDADSICTELVSRITVLEHINRYIDTNGKVPSVDDIINMLAETVNQL